MMLSRRGLSTKHVHVRNSPTIAAQTPAVRHLVPACLSDDSKLTIQQEPKCPGDLTSPVHCGHCHKLPLFGKVGGSAMAPVKLFVECQMASYCSLSLRLFDHTHTHETSTRKFTDQTLKDDFNSFHYCVLKTLFFQPFRSSGQPCRPQCLWTFN